MREYVLVTTADVLAEHLWAVAADVQHWPDWQPRVQPSDTRWAVPTPAGGEWAGLRVVEARPPVRLVAAATRFLAQLRVGYEFEPLAQRTLVRVEVQLRGPLRLAYWRSFDRHLRGTFSTLVGRLIERARRVSEPDRPPANPGRAGGAAVPPLVA